MAYGSGSGYLDSPLRPFRDRLAAKPKPPMQPSPRPTPTPTTTSAQPTEPQQPRRPELDDPLVLSDPLLIRAKKLAETQRGDANASALARKKRLAIETGDEKLAREFGLDEDTIRAARENPLSTFALLREAGRLEERALNDRRNKENLWYSGTRANDLSQLAKELLAREAQAGSRARDTFTGIQNDLLEALGAADAYEQDALADAYANAVDAYRNGANPTPTVVPDPVEASAHQQAAQLIAESPQSPILGALVAELIGGPRLNVVGGRSYGI